MKKRSPGRPKGSVAEKTRDALIQLKVFADERDAYAAAADRNGLSMSGWIRQILNKAAKD